MHGDDALVGAHLSRAAPAWQLGDGRGVREGRGGCDGCGAGVERIGEGEGGAGQKRNASQGLGTRGGGGLREAGRGAVHHDNALVGTSHPFQVSQQHRAQCACGRKEAGLSLEHPSPTRATTNVTSSHLKVALRMVPEVRSGGRRSVRVDTKADSVSLTPAPPPS